MRNRTRALCLLCVAPLLLWTCHGPGADRSDDDAARAKSAHGAELYAVHCAVCHGAEGRGDGSAAPLLLPAARDFTGARFRLASTLNGVPTDADLIATLSRGVPGSAMPAWSWMPHSDLDALATQVRTLARRGAKQRVLAEPTASGHPMPTSEARELARVRTTPSAAVTLPRTYPDSPSALQHGRELFERHCAECHGTNGKGRPAQPRNNEDGSLNWARDFTAGFLKGGATHDAIATRIAVGLPGSAMPSFATMPLDDLGALTSYVTSMIPHGADAWLVQSQGEVRAARVSGEVPSEPLDERWSQAREVEVVLAPLSWRDNAVFSAKLSALHDGTSLAIRVRWHDATRDEGALDHAQLRDGVALAFSNDPEPPLFGMGAHEHPVNLWHWKAERLIDAAGLLDLISATPHRIIDPVFGESKSDVSPRYLPAPSSAESGGKPVELSAETFDKLRQLQQSGSVVASNARWADDEWSVVFVRSLAPRAAQEVALEPGAQVLAACAIWNASIGDRAGCKSISIWQRLVIE